MDEERFISLNVITNKRVPDKKGVEDLINEMRETFESPLVTKDEIVKIIASYIPGFKHIETGRSLDGKM